MTFATSSPLALILNGQIQHILTPWKIHVDLQAQTITITKRNWYLISQDKNTIAFRFIRQVHVDKHIFGADLHIKTIASGTVSAFYLPKRQADFIKSELITYSSNKQGGARILG